MTGYQSKKAAARDKMAQPEQELIVGTKTWFEDGKVITQHLTAKEVYKEPAQEPWRESASDYERGVIDGRQKQAQSSVDKAVNRMAQRPWVGLTEGEWFEWWRVSQVANETEAEIDFADFLIIAQAVITKLKEKNNAA